MKKIMTLFAMFLLMGGILMAQDQPSRAVINEPSTETRAKFNYQAVLRHNADHDMANQLVRNQSGTAVFFVGDQAIGESMPFTTNDNGMVSLVLESPAGFSWRGVTLTAHFILDADEEEIIIVTPVTAVPYAVQAENVVLTTAAIESYLNPNNTNGLDVDLVYQALKANSSVHDALRDTIVNFIKTHYVLAKEVAYHYMHQVTAADVQEAYAVGQSLDPEVKAAVYDIIKRYLKEHRNLLVEVAEYYISEATEAELQELYDALQNNYSASTKVKAILDKYFESYLKRRGLWCDEATVCDISDIINNRPTCPSLGSTRTPLLQNNTLYLCATVKNYDANHIERGQFAITVNADIELLLENVQFRSAATGGYEMIASLDLSQEAIRAQVSGKLLTITPWLIITDCGDNSEIEGTPVTFQVPAECPQANVSTLEVRPVGGNYFTEFNYSGEGVVSGKYYTPEYPNGQELNDAMNVSDGHVTIAIPEANVNLNDGETITVEVTITGAGNCDLVNLSGSYTASTCPTVSNLEYVLENNLLKLTANANVNSAALNEYFRIATSNTQVDYGVRETIYDAQTGKMSYTLTQDEMQELPAGQLTIYAVLAVDPNVCGAEEVLSEPVLYTRPTCPTPGATTVTFIPESLTVSLNTTIVGDKSTMTAAWYIVSYENENVDTLIASISGEQNSNYFYYGSGFSSTIDKFTARGIDILGKTITFTPVAVCGENTNPGDPVERVFPSCVSVASNTFTVALDNGEYTGSFQYTGGDPNNSYAPWVYGYYWKNGDISSVDFDGSLANGSLTVDRTNRTVTVHIPATGVSSLDSVKVNLWFGNFGLCPNNGQTVVTYTAPTSNCPQIGTIVGTYNDDNNSADRWYIYYDITYTPNGNTINVSDIEIKVSESNVTPHMEEDLTVVSNEPGHIVLKASRHSDNHYANATFGITINMPGQCQNYSSTKNRFTPAVTCPTLGEPTFCKSVGADVVTITIKTPVNNYDANLVGTISYAVDFTIPGGGSVATDQSEATTANIFTEGGNKVCEQVVNVNKSIYDANQSMILSYTQTLGYTESCNGTMSVSSTSSSDVSVFDMSVCEDECPSFGATTVSVADDYLSMRAILNVPANYNLNNIENEGFTVHFHDGTHDGAEMEIRGDIVTVDGILQLKRDVPLYAEDYSVLYGKAIFVTPHMRLVAGECTGDFYGEVKTIDIPSNCPTFGATTVDYVPGTSNSNGIFTITTTINNPYHFELVNGGYYLFMTDYNAETGRRTLLRACENSCINPPTPEGVTVTFNGDSTEMVAIINVAELCANNSSNYEYDYILHLFNDPDYHLDIEPYIQTNTLFCGNHGYIEGAEYAYSYFASASCPTLDATTVSRTGIGIFTVSTPVTNLADASTASNYGYRVSVEIPGYTFTPISYDKTDYPNNVNLTTTTLSASVDLTNYFTGIDPTYLNTLMSNATVTVTPFIEMYNTTCGTSGEVTGAPAIYPEPEFTCGTDNLVVGNNSYSTVQIGSQCWTAQNMREVPDGATNGSDLTENNYSATDPFYYVKPGVDASVYGYYYNWPAAKLVCPEGWHLPSYAEWDQLHEYVSNYMENNEYKYRCGGDSVNIAKALASGAGWNNDNGECTPGGDQNAYTNATGFGAVPVGGRNNDYNGAYYSAFGNFTNFWSATDAPDLINYAWFRVLNNNSAIVPWYFGPKNGGYSVRCLKN